MRVSSLGVACALVLGGVSVARAGGIADAEDGAATTVVRPALAANGDGVFERDTVDMAPANGVAIDDISIENRFGDVRIEGHDGATVMILAYKRAPDDETLNRVKVALVPDPSGPIRIVTTIASGTELRPIPSGTVRVDLVVRAPRNAHVNARVWNGGLALVGVDAGGELDANEGKITVSNVSGPVSARNTVGDQVFTSLFGVLEAEGMDGNIALDTVRGTRLDAAVQHGSIVATRIRAKHLALRTTHGDITLRGEVVPDGSYRVSSADGDIEVAFAVKGSLTVWARARAGTVTVPVAMKRRDRDGSVAASWGRSKRGAAIELRSRHGNIRFALADSD